MKNRLFRIIIIVYLFLFIVTPLFSSSWFEDLQLNPFDYARITDVDYKAIVMDEPDTGGSVRITERLTFDVHAASKNNLYWELWRDLPEDYIDGVKVDYTVNSVKQILEDGTEIVYSESPRLYWEDYDYVNTNPSLGPGKWYHSEGPYSESDARYECVFFYVDGLYREKVVFEIEYEMHNAALRYNDCSDLYLSLYSGSTIRHLNSFQAQILFPNKDMPSSGNYDVYTYGTNAGSFPITESADSNPGYYTFSISLDDEQLKFRPYNEYIEFDLVSHGEDRHIFTEYAPENNYSDDDVLNEIYQEQQVYADTPETFRVKKLGILVLCVVCSIAVAVYCLTSGSRIRKKHTFYKANVNTDCFSGLPSDLDPVFASFLIFCRHRAAKIRPEVYSALLLSLARKGYIEIQEIPPNNARISISISTQQAPLDFKEPLTVNEAYFYNLLVRHTTSGSIMMSEFQTRVSTDYENTNAFVKNMKKSIVNIGVNEGYFQKADYAEVQKMMWSRSTFFMICGVAAFLLNVLTYFTRIDFAFGAFFIIGAICLAGSVFLRVQGGKYVLLTQFGEDEYAKWRGFYRYLKNDIISQNEVISESTLGEKYLVYAAAFGLSGKKIKAITLKCTDASESSILHSGYYSSRQFHRYGHHFHSSVHSGSFGGGGGFGYGGGGRGGGGGGGGH